MSMKNKTIRILLSWMILAMILTTGCSHAAETPQIPSEISARSVSAGYIAAEAEARGGFIAGSEQREKASEYAYLYDNALAVIVLSRAGAQGQAELIADAMVFAQTHDRTFKDGRLRNVYIAGDPRSDSGRTLTPGNVTIRLPGFWQDGKWQEETYAVSTSTGNMAWAMLALCTVAGNASPQKRTEYLEAAIRAADFMLTLRSEHSGFTAGYEGWDESQRRISYLSTEHNVVLACALSSLADAIAETDPDRAAEYREAAEYAKEFVFSMYDEKLHCFYTGTKDDGKTISEGVIPLDSHTLSVLAFPDDVEDTYAVLSFVEDRMSVGDGFDFSAGDLDGIWNEGTAQMAVCYKMIDSKDKYDAVMAYLKTEMDKDGCIPAADRDGVSTGFVIDGTDELWEYNNTRSISATCWLAFAQLGIDPFTEIPGQ